MAKHPPHPEKLIGKQLGRYRITNMLGRGGMGAVYRAEPLDGGQVVAIKVLLSDPDSDQEQHPLERFQREVEVHKNLDHPHIVKVHEASEDQGTAYLVMSLMEGGSLHDRIRRERFTPEETLRYLWQICSALDYIHDQNIFHRDMKPANILLDAKGDAALTDFGIALQLGQTRLTREGTVMATDLYASPEQWLGEEISGRSDIYALGGIVFEMLTGRPPFVSDRTNKREQISDLGLMHCRQQPPSVTDYRPDLSPIFGKVIRKALQKAPDQRYPFAGSFAEAFEMAINGELSPYLADLPDLDDEEPPLTRPIAQPLAVNPLPVQASADDPDAVAPSVAHHRLVLIFGAVSIILLLLLIVALLSSRPVIPSPTASFSSTASPTLTPTTSPTWTPSITASPIPSDTPTSTSTVTALESPQPNQNTLIAMVLATETQHAAETAVALAQTPSPTPIPPIPTETSTSTITPQPTASPTPFFLLGEDNHKWVTQQRSFEGVVMVYVPAGCFTMGADAGEKNEQPEHTVCLQSSFWIDQTEVSNWQFSAFGGKANIPSNWSGTDLPRESISWAEARDFCALRGARLPTESEWEYAARGPGSWLYPWGNDFEADRVVYGNNSGDKTASVGSRPNGISWVGALDMSGNVWEWVSSLYRPYPYGASDGRENMEINSGMRVARGGSWNRPAELVRAASRTSADPLSGYQFIGFRCARSVE